MLRILLEEFIGDLRTQKLRAFLTTLAVVWGTIAIVLLLSFGEGLKVAVYDGIVNAGDHMFMVGGGETSKVFEGLPKGRRVRLTEADLELVRRSIPEVDLASPSYGRNTTAEHGKVKTRSYMEGVGPDFETLRRMLPGTGGRFLDVRDITDRRRVVFLGDSIAYRLFGREDPIGKLILLDRLPFTVVGVMPHKMQMGMNNGPDDERIIIPAPTFRAIYGNLYVNHLLIRPRDLKQAAYVKHRIYEVLGRHYQFDPDDERALWFWDFIEDAKENRAIGVGIQIFLGIVGGFTLLLAGVGVANIMYVVVKERTREIGVKLAIGARKRHIMAQFTFEALLLCFVGGMIGLAFSTAVVLAVAAMPKGNMATEILTNPHLSLPIALMTVGILMLIGLVAGVFPARRAAAVDPVESLRYE